MEDPNPFSPTPLNQNFNQPDAILSQLTLFYNTISIRDYLRKSFCPALWKQTSPTISIRLNSAQKRSRIVKASSLNPTLFFIALAPDYSSSASAAFLPTYLV
ncbi:hypothetical protein TNCT_310931 [Trichonephila clavata]|uniref:Uncharacterized protein n=1 Tax=Trichonephila clavata TaxID=2740835 RepID=A0A8X6KZ78_TRICU|nr:hypothetical protein TNCT_310931 [Trichonephila clavata]